MSPSTLAAGIDVGGTKTRAVALDDRDMVVADVAFRTDARGGDAVVDSTLSALEALALRLDVPVRGFAALGVGIPGLVDVAAGTVRHAVNLGVDGRPVAIGPRLSDATGLRCRVENDVNAAALGALEIVAPPGTTDLAYLGVGTGVAAALILGGKPWRGHRGAAGEIGHFPVDPNGPRCRCGRRGCLEAVASGAAIARMWPGRDGTPAAASLIAAADAGDPDAIRIRGTVLGHLARAVELLAVTYDVDCIVIGGGIADAGDGLLTRLRATLAELDGTTALVGTLDLRDRVRLAPAAEPLGAIGAALTARRAL